MEAAEPKTESSLGRNLILVASYVLLMVLIAIGYSS